MTQMTNYKGCTISATTQRLANTGQTLYAISGRFEKTAGLRPFLPSIRAAREWISECALSEEMSGIDWSVLV